MIRATCLCLALVLAATTSAAGCSAGSVAIGSPEPTTIDGYPIGAVATCQDGCDRFVAHARAWLDQADPQHARVATAEVRHLGADIVITRSGGNGDFVVVLGLVDGSVRATFVLCGIGVARDRCFTYPADQLHLR
jgi:hypothetical protein